MRDFLDMAVAVISRSVGRRGSVGLSSRRRQGEAHPKLLPQPWIVHANVDTVEVDVEAMCVEVEAKGVDAKAVEAVPGKRAIPVEIGRASCRERVS